LRNLRNGRDDIGIGRTSAEIATHAFADLVVIEDDVTSSQVGRDDTGPPGLGLAQHPDCRTDLSWSTITALEGVVVDERLLEWMQLLLLSKALDRDDPGVLMGNGKGQATIHAPAIKQHGTGSALSMITTFLRAGEPQVLA
jgi:hypothetical protein